MTNANKLLFAFESVFASFFFSCFTTDTVVEGVEVAAGGVLVAGGVYGPHPRGPQGGAEHVPSHRHPNVQGITDGTVMLTAALEELSDKVVVASPSVYIAAVLVNMEVGVLGDTSATTLIGGSVAPASTG